jgi:hypothetical protein
MPAVPFSQLPDHARLWIFAADRPLDARESATLLDIVDRFVAGWAAHGAPVVGGRDWRHDRFLLVGADERATGVSGCSTDTLFHALGAAEQTLGVSLRDASLVFWRDEHGAIHSAPRPGFRALAAAGSVDGTTVVFDHTIPTVGDLRERWEVRLADSWHARAFPAGATR